MRLSFAFLLMLLSTLKLPAQIKYPFPVQYLQLTIENKKQQMAYMDVSPEKPNGKTIILFHGKNFNGYYLKNEIPMVSYKCYSEIIP
jgi:hypothetical protein